LQYSARARDRLFGDLLQHITDTIGLGGSVALSALLLAVCAFLYRGVQRYRLERDGKAGPAT